MSYIGRSPAYGSAVSQQISGTNSAGPYVLLYETNTSGVVISLDGVVQRNSVDFNIVGTALTFTSTVGTGIIINVVFTGLTLSFPTPSDGSVDSSAIVAGAVDDSHISGLAASKLTGTVAIANGGTGAATHTANNVLIGNGTSAITSVAPSTSGNVLTSNGSAWASTAPAGGGKMLQCLNAVTNTTGSTTSTSFIDSPLTLAITPSATSSKILVVTTFYYAGNHYTNSGTHVALFRDSTQLSTDIVTGHDSANYSGDAGQAASFSYLDSPSSTSSLTFKLKYKTEGTTAYFNQGISGTNWGQGTSSLTLMEISA